MNRGFTISPELLTIGAQERRARGRLALWVLAFLAIASMQAYTLWLYIEPASLVAWLCLLFCIGAIVYHPRNGLYMLVGLSIAGDASLTPWFPFRKNFSSWESLLFFSNSFSFTPFEICLAATCALWFLRMAFQRKWEIRLTPLLIPLTLFTLCAAFGMVYGLGRGGDRVIGLWEARSIFYVLPIYLLASNLLTERSHINILIWSIIIGNIVEGIFGTVYVASVLGFQLSGVEAIGEHSMSIHFNAYFVLLLASWLYKTSPAKRITLLLGLPVVLLSYIANNRRASFITMAIALMIFALVLFRNDRKRFWLIIPPLAAIGAVYIAVFWNSSGALGAPAKAIRSVIGQPDPRDASSNLYRLYENINIMYTIHKVPLTGVGFGQKFHIVIPMADISIFPWWEYIPHNSVLWIWMKTGVVGFISLISAVGLSVATGARTLWRMPNDEMGMAALLAVCYVIMHFVFAYVDMSWEAANMAMVGVLMGVSACLIPLVANQPEPEAKRWPWQPDPQPLPGLIRSQGERA